MRTPLEHDVESASPAAAEPRRRLDGTVRALAALVCGALTAAPALAVAVSVTLTGVDGQPVPSAEIDLGFGAKATTDGSGRATIDVPEERIGEEDVVVGITFVVNETTGETRTVERRVPKLGLGLDFRLTPREQQPERQPERPATTDGLPPGRELGCAFAGAGFQVGFGVGTGEVDETPLDEQRFEFIAFVNGSEVDRTSGSKSAAELAETNRMEKKKHERDEIGPISLRIPLIPGDSCRDRGVKFVPALRLGAGQVDADFTSTNVEMPQFSQSLSGDGWMYGGGIDLTLLRAERRCVYGLGLEHWRSESIDMRRSVDLATFFGPGAMTLRDDISYEYETTSIRLTAGHAGDRFLPYAGVRYTWFEAELDQRNAIDVTALFPTAPPGTVVVQDQHIVGFFDDDYVEAVAGIMARIGERAAARAEGAVGEDSFEVKLTALLTF